MRVSFNSADDLVRSSPNLLSPTGSLLVCKSPALMEAHETTLQTSLAFRTIVSQTHSVASGRLILGLSGWAAEGPRRPGLALRGPAQFATNSSGAFYQGFPEQDRSVDRLADELNLHVSDCRALLSEHLKWLASCEHCKRPS